MTLFWEIWGTLAGLITVSGYLPQIIKGYRTKRLTDLSYMLNALMGFGMAMWTVYGFSIGSIAVVATNMLGIATNLILMSMKFYYSKKATKSF